MAKVVFVCENCEASDEIDLVALASCGFRLQCPKCNKEYIYKSFDDANEKSAKEVSVILFHKFDGHREETKVCPQCGENIKYVGINKLAYTMDICTCRKEASWDHIVEQIWHKACLVEYLMAHPDEQTSYRYLAPSNKTCS